MSIADQQRVKELERALEALEARVLLLEMQKRPVEPVTQPKRETITLRARAQ